MLPQRTAVYEEAYLAEGPRLLVGIGLIGFVLSRPTTLSGLSYFVGSVAIILLCLLLLEMAISLTVP